MITAHAEFRLGHPRLILNISEIPLTLELSQSQVENFCIKHRDGIAFVQGALAHAGDKNFRPLDPLAWEFTLGDHFFRPVTNEDFLILVQAYNLISHGRWWNFV